MNLQWLSILPPAPPEKWGINFLGTCHLGICMDSRWRGSEGKEIIHFIVVFSWNTYQRKEWLALLEVMVSEGKNSWEDDCQVQWAGKNYFINKYIQVCTYVYVNVLQRCNIMCWSHSPLLSSIWWRPVRSQVLVQNVNKTCWYPAFPQEYTISGGCQAVPFHTPGFCIWGEPYVTWWESNTCKSFRYWFKPVFPQAVTFFCNCS